MVTRPQSAASGTQPKLDPAPFRSGQMEPAKLPRMLQTTLLSGFLGAGKTTLMKNILKNKENLRCAVIVNDMATINIDASLLKNSQLIQTEEKLVEMQNGCICCTLREDLLLEVSKLAQANRFDHLIIESTGVSEPMQVAETFGMQLEGEEHADIPPLKDLAALDACITVVDAANLMANLKSIKTLKEQQANSSGEGVAEEDERNVADLLVDQIEFADVILLNKVDLVPVGTAKLLAEFIKALNPDARVIQTRECEVPLKEVLQTGAFSMEKAQQAPGWLKAMKEGVQPTPETEEYGISTFVYRARQPFHPERLYDLLEDLFIIQQEQEIEDGDEACEHDHAHGHGQGPSHENNSIPSQGGAAEEAEMTDAEGAEAEAVRAEEDGGEGSEEELDEEDAAQMQANLHKKFGQVLRSKGFVWLAGNDVMSGEWSQAGTMLRMSCGGPWFAAIPREAWNVENGDDAEIMADFEGDWGDRRQELVFIGISLKTTEIIKALDACLATPEDVLKDPHFKSPFLPWPNKVELEDIEESDDGVKDIQE